MMNMRVPEDVWKWIAGSILVISIAFLTPSIGWFIDSRSRISPHDFALVAERQQTVLQRLAVIETRLDEGDMDRAELRQQLGEIERLLREHVLIDASKP